MAEENKVKPSLDMIYEISSRLDQIVKDMKVEAGSDPQKIQCVAHLENHLSHWVQLVKAVVETSGKKGNADELRNAFKMFENWEKRSEEIDLYLDKLYNIL